MKLFKASFLNPYSDHSCDYFDLAALLVNEDGEIISLESWDEKKDYSEYELIDLSNKLIMPCFADIHFHWVQEDVCQMPKANLMTWLEAYTWPSEAKYENKLFSKIRAEHFFRDIIKLGTTMGAAYSSIHEHAVHDAFHFMKGDFFIGAVIMTKGKPDYLIQDEAEALEIAERLAQHYSENYVITPRFAPSCTKSSMRSAAKIAQKYNCWIQTHVAETTDPEESSLKILDDCEILTSKTILGHCIHLDSADYDLIAERGAKIAHCPSSNAPIGEMGLGSGLFDFALAEESGVDWALASDIGAGPYLSMFDVMKSFYDQNQIHLNDSEDELQFSFSSEATAIKALYRATLKGAEILGLDSRKGNFKPTKDADFIVIDKSNIDLNEYSDAEDILLSILDKDRSSFNSLVEDVYLKGILV